MATKIKFNFNVYGLVESIEESGTTYTLKVPMDRPMLKAQLSSRGLLPISDSEFILVKSSGGGGISSTNLNQFLNSLWTTNLKYNSDVGQMIFANFFPCPVNKTIFELLQPFLDFTNLSESQVQFLLDNYFWNNLELFELNIWMGDKRESVNLNENEKVTIDCNTLKNHNFSNGVLEIIDWRLDNGTSSWHFQFEFVEFNKDNIKIEGRHFSGNSNYKNTYNAVHSIQLVLK